MASKLDIFAQSNLLVIDEKDKFKWRGNLTQFKRFVEDILCVKGKWNTPGGGSRQIRNEKIGFRLYDTGTIITLCGPKVEEYNEKLRDIALAQEYKLDQQDQASHINASVDEHLLNVTDDLFGESVAQAEPSVCEIVNDEVASELVWVLPLKHAVNDIQIH
jgi:hypothetical protein